MRNTVISRIWPILAGIALLGLLLSLRYIGFVDVAFANMAPVCAMALCFGLFFRGSTVVLLLAFGALMLSDVLVTYMAVKQDGGQSFWGLLFSPTVLLRYLVYALFVVGACTYARRRSALSGLVFTPLLTLAFYGMMNTVAWFTSIPPFAYAKTLAGWWQSQTVGLPIPGAPPSYFFLRNALVGDLLFTGLFVVLVVWLPSSWRSTDSALKLSENAV